MTTLATLKPTQQIGFLDAFFADVPLESVSIQLPNGTVWPDDQPRAAVITLKRPDALGLLFGAPDERTLAEAFLRGDVDVVGDLGAAVELADVLAARGGVKQELLRTWLQVTRRPASPPRGQGWRRWRDFSGARHTRERDRQAVSFHYDVSNEFFQLWLDPRMIYSCAYFEERETDLATAQTAKLEYLCRKLRIQPGQRVLDIGCGWGGFALYAARHHHVRVRGITLSEQQAQLATTRVKEAGLESAISIELRDIRDVDGAEAFDAIVSVGMSEHVGRRQLPGYFGKVASLLRPGGAFLNHAIGHGVIPRRAHGETFMQEMVFPDSETPSIPTVLAAGEGEGLEVRDVENLREHYRLTLRHWAARLEAQQPAALASVDERTFRLWRLYLASAARNFERGHLAIYQALFAKPDGRGNAHVPLTRRDWYV
jgi:cyclopropane-fatty-acyl-phospholipid synthase